MINIARLNTTTKQKWLAVLFFWCGAVALCLVAAKSTFVYAHQGQVEVDTTPCTDQDWRTCQHRAFVHLSEAVRAYPQAKSYTVRWSDTWLQPFADDSFELTYDRLQGTLEEGDVGANGATMFYGDRVTANAIHSLAASSGGFEALPKYGGNYQPP